MANRRGFLGGFVGGLFAAPALASTIVRDGDKEMSVEVIPPWKFGSGSVVVENPKWADAGYHVVVSRDGSMKIKCVTGNFTFGQFADESGNINVGVPVYDPR